MKALCFFMTIFLSFSIFLPASEEDILFSSLKFTYCSGVFLDWGITQFAIDCDLATEGNPIGSLYMKQPALSFAITFGVMMFTEYIFDELYKKNKLVACIIVIGAALLKGFLVYHNWKIIE